jgi:hypothetical protein
MEEALESAQKAKEQLEYWRKSLTDCIAFLDAGISDISSGKPPNKVLSIIQQHIALIRPWFLGLINSFPAKAPDNILVTRLPYRESSEHSLNLWGQCVSHRDPNRGGILNRETDTI